MSSNWPELHYRPSPLLRGALLLIGVLAGASVLASALPWWGALLAPLPALFAAWRLGSSPRDCLLRFGSDGRAWRVENGRETVLQRPELAERGPLVVLRARDASGAVGFSFAPDTLGRADRRHLRLWFAAQAGERADAIALMGS